MPSLYNESTKKAIYKWRKTHKTKFNEYQAILMKDYHLKNIEKERDYHRKRYIFQKECKRLRNILI